MGNKKKILFVCKHNEFRSKIAEALFKKLNKNKNISVKSAGIIKGGPINSDTKRICKLMGVNLIDPPHGLSTSLLIWQNMTVIVADDVPRSIFKENKKYGKKLIVWKIHDAEEISEKAIGKVLQKIEKRMNKFVKRLQ